MEQIAIDPMMCPECKAEGKRATFIEGRARMEPGVIAVCGVCGNINVVNDADVLETALGYYLRAIERAWPDVYGMLMSASATVKAAYAAATVN